MTTFGHVIRQARMNIGYSQRKLATLVEVDFTYLSKLESDSTEYPPKEYVVQQLAHYLGLDRDELMCLTGRLPEHYQDFLKQNYKVMPAGIIHSRSKNSLSMSWARNRSALVRES